MESKGYSLLGLAVMAGKVSFGHDAVKQNIRQKIAFVLLFSTDAYSRMRE